MGLVTQTSIFSRVWLPKFCLEIFTETTGILEDTWQHTTEKHMELHKHLYFKHSKLGSMTTLLPTISMKTVKTNLMGPGLPFSWSLYNYSC